MYSRSDTDFDPKQDTKKILKINKCLRTAWYRFFVCFVDASNLETSYAGEIRLGANLNASWS